MLWRALRHVNEGFYIDIGAAWPDEHSVTKAFYERGWCGINVEPNPELLRQLVDRRPRDRNLEIAVGEREGTLTLSILKGTGLSTLDDATARKHQRSGRKLDQQRVHVTTLADVWRQYVPSDQEVHFLKVDVEGYELPVLRGNNWNAYRPWVVVIEAMQPTSQLESHDVWESILLAADYQFAYADGLNRFYVAQERSDLLPAFKYPPNVFDEFLPSHQHEAEMGALQAEARLIQLEAALGATRQELHDAEASLDATRQELHDIQQANDYRWQLAERRAIQAEERLIQVEEALAANRQELHNVHQANHDHWRLAEVRQARIEALLSSRSWRVTAPLRRGLDMLRLIPVRKGKVAKPPERLRSMVIHALSRPRLVTLVHACLRPFPGLHRYTTGLITRIVAAPASQSPKGVATNGEPEASELDQLTPRARQIYRDLRAAIESRQKENL